MNKFSSAAIIVAFSCLISCNSGKEEKPRGEIAATQEMVVTTENAAGEEMVQDKSLEPGSPAFRSDAEGKPEETSAPAASNQTTAAKKIIKDGNMSVKARDIHESKQRIDLLLQSLNAYYESEDLQNNDRSITYSLKIRVPAAQFESLIRDIESGKDEIISKSIQARDITEEYVDIETRLLNKREYLKRYKGLLNKAVSVKDIVIIEENIRNLQEEIESKEGRLKYLNDQVNYSTLFLQLNQDKEFVYKPQEHDRFSERVKTALNKGWTSNVSLIVGLISIWPFLILFTAAYFFYKQFIIKKRNPNT